MSDQPLSVVPEVIQICPPEWWQIVLVGMALPEPHPSIQVKPRMPKGEKYEGPVGAWRTPRVGAKGMKARDFDNALRAGQREVTEARVKMTPGMLLHDWESRCRQASRERERVLCEWMASWAVVPYLVRPHGHNWSMDFGLVQDLRRLGIEPECWTFDDEHMDRVPVPGILKAAA